MNSKNIDFRYLLDKACAAFGETQGQVMFRFHDFPICLVHYLDKKECVDCIEISFDRENALVTYYFDRGEVNKSALITFFHALDPDLFISYLTESGYEYCYRKKYWLVDGKYCIKLDENKFGTQFFLFRLADAK